MGLTTTIGYYQPAGDTYQPAGTYPAGNYGYTPSRSTNLREDLEIGEEDKNNKKRMNKNPKKRL